jgi:hypothetical protein
LVTEIEMLNVVFCIWCAEIIEEKLVKRDSSKKEEKIHALHSF